MKITRQQTEAYSIPSEYYFSTRSARNAYFTTSPQSGTYTAIGNDTTGWEVDVFNGINWTLVSIDDSFALVVTNDGLKALTYLSPAPGYQLKITKVWVRQDVIPVGVSPISWTLADFNNNTVVLKTDGGDSSFTLDHNITYKVNMGNGGLQYCVRLEPATLGRDYSQTPSPILSEYYVGAVALIIQDPITSQDILFAVGNMHTAVKKYSTTAVQTGNSIRLYLNTAISNLGYISNASVMPETVSSVPEVVSEEDLETTYRVDTSPYNLVLIDNYSNTNIPAIAVRSGTPTVGSNIEWKYFTPNDDSVEIKSEDIGSGLKDFMAAAYNQTTGKYVPADGDDPALPIQGIKIGNRLVYAGLIRNNNVTNSYTMSVVNYGTGYTVGDELTYTHPATSTTFTFKVQNVQAGTGAIAQFTFTPTNGNASITASNVTPTNVGSSAGTGFTINIASTSHDSTNTYIWNFPSNWINKPIYVSASTPGEFTLDETFDFVGWVITSNSIKLGLDVRNYADYNTYGITRYADASETSDVAGNPTAKEDTAINPKQLQDNYIQRTLAVGNPGESVTNPINVYTYIKFNAPLYGRGIDPVTFGDPLSSENVSFYGKAYRALWGDLAEYYHSDKAYSNGTLVCIGDGDQEVTIAKTECNGIVSSKPGYILGEKNSDLDLPIALIGKVPVMFASDCMPKFGDRIYLSKTEYGKASNMPNGKCLGKIIDKREELHKYANSIMCSVKLSF